MELMCHCSSFLLPPESLNNNNNTCILSHSYALVVLNQRLPRFAPLLWDHGTLAFGFLSSSSYSTFIIIYLLLLLFLVDWCDVIVVCETGTLTAQVRVCADGGANRVYDEMPLLFPHQDVSHVRFRFLSSLFSFVSFVTVTSVLPLVHHNSQNG